MKPSAKRALLKLFNDECLYCATELTIKSMTVEHLVPRSWGGSYQKSNLALACSTCNNARGAQDLHLYIATLPSMEQVYAKLAYVKVLVYITYKPRPPREKIKEKPKYNKFWANLGYGVKL